MKFFRIPDWGFLNARETEILFGMTEVTMWVC